MSNIFSYTQRDYEGARKEGLSKIPILSEGTWTDLNPSDPGIIMLDYVHALVDMIQYYQDHNALEVFLTTARERKNIFRIAQQLSYKVRSAKGAKLDVEFYVKETYDQTIMIPRHTVLSTEDGIEYLTSEVAYLNPGETSVIVPCTQGTVKYTTYQGTGTSKYSNVEVQEDQTLILADQNIDIDTITIHDENGRVWNPIDYIVFSESDDRVYQKDLQPDGTIVLTFGDGQRGKLLTEADVLSIEYVSSLAEEGRVGARTVENIHSKIFDVLGNEVTIYVTNLDSSSGGAGPQSDEDIVSTAPGVIKAQDRAVTLKDFEALATQVEGVKSAIAYDINTAPDMCLYHEVKVVIVPDTSYTANASLAKAAYDYLYERMIPPTNLQVLTPQEYTIDLDISVVRNLSYLEGGLMYSIHEVVNNYFQEKSMNIGSAFNPEELKSLISRVSGVRYVESMTPNQEVTVSKLSIIKLGNINVSIKE